MDLRLPMLLLVAATTACGGGAASRPSITIPIVSVQTPATKHLRDDECPALLRMIDAVEVRCPDRALSRKSLEDPKTREALEGCVNDIVATVARLRDPEVIRAARYAAWSNRVIGSAEVAQASLELAGATASSSGDPSGTVDPAFELAFRQRAHGYASVRGWCAVDPRPPQTDAWADSVKPILLGLEPQFGQCIAKAREQLPLTVAAGTEMTLNWKAFINPDGRARAASQVDYPSSMRADVGLCILGVIERTRFPKPEGEAIIGSNVTFVKQP